MASGRRTAADTWRHGMVGAGSWEDPAVHRIRPSTGRTRPRTPDSETTGPRTKSSSVTGQGYQRNDYSTSTQHSLFLSGSPRSSLTANRVLTSRSSLPGRATSVIHRGHLKRRGLPTQKDYCADLIVARPALESFTGGWDSVLSPSPLRGQICPFNSL